MPPSTAPSNRARLAGVYLLTPDADAQQFERVLAVLEIALAAGVGVVQYRNKRVAPETQVEQARRVVALAHAAGALAIVNDDIEVALQSGADGVHLGRDDGELPLARTQLAGRLLGASCYDDIAQAERAVAAGADAIAFGAMFASTTKPGAVRAPLALLPEARRRWPAVRVVGIGGIDIGNIASVAAAGAHAAALMAAVFDSTDPAAAVRVLVQQFNEGLARYELQRTTV